MTSPSYTRLLIENESSEPRLISEGSGGTRRVLPVAPSVLPIARRLAAGGAAAATVVRDGVGADFTAAAFAQLVAFSLHDEGALSRYVDYDALLPAGAPPARPREVSMILTKLCNLRCLHCYNDSALRDPHELNHDEKLRVVDYLGRWGVTVLNLTGGEPTIDPAFPEILALARRYRMGVKISTNAWRFAPVLLDAIRAGTVIQLSISLDGMDAATHDHIRQRTGSFDRVLGSLRELETCKPRTVVLNAGVHRNSLAQMDAVAAFAVEQPIDVVAFKPVTSSGRPGIQPPFLLGHAELAAFVSTRDRLRREYAGRLVIDGKLTGDDVQPELQDDLSCQAAHTAMVVKADGAMLPCDTLAGVPDAPNFRDVPPVVAWLDSPVFGWFRGLRDASSGGCGSAGCPGAAASKEIARSGPPVFVPLQALARPR